MHYEIFQRFNNLSKSNFFSRSGFYVLTLSECKLHLFLFFIQAILLLVLDDKDVSIIRKFTKGDNARVKL